MAVRKAPARNLTAIANNPLQCPAWFKGCQASQLCNIKADSLMKGSSETCSDPALVSAICQAAEEVLGFTEQCN